MFELNRFSLICCSLVGFVAWFILVNTSFGQDVDSAQRRSRQADGSHSMSIQMVPVREKTIRTNPTTQIEIRRTGWNYNVLSLWLPESVFSDFGIHLWKNGDESQEERSFKRLPNGLGWQFENDKFRIDCMALSDGDVVDVTCLVLNKTSAEMPNVYVQNCLHFPKAIDFSGKAGEHVFFRKEGEWVTMDSTRNWFDRSSLLVDTTKFFFRKETIQTGRYSTVQGSRNVRPERSDHPMIVIESNDQEYSVAIAGRSWDFVFHNTNPKLGCIHSQPLPVRLMPLETVEFRQRIYLCDGDVNDLLKRYARDALSFGKDNSEVKGTEFADERSNLR